MHRIFRRKRSKPKMLWSMGRGRGQRGRKITARFRRGRDGCSGRQGTCMVTWQLAKRGKKIMARGTRMVNNWAAIVFTNRSTSKSNKPSHQWLFSYHYKNSFNLWRISNDVYRKRHNRSNIYDDLWISSQIYKWPIQPSIWAQFLWQILKIITDHYKKYGDLWRKFYDILMEHHNCTQSMMNLKVWTLGPELCNFYWIHRNWAHKTWRFNINVIKNHHSYFNYMLWHFHF
jgi:hypothetical protein